MKKAAKWLTIISIVVFIIAWGIMGVKLLNNDYHITIEAYTGLISLVVLCICVVYIKLANRCPHCGKTISSFGPYCPHCGKEVN